MNTIARNYSSPAKATNSWRFAAWISRFPLVAVTVLFTVISIKFIFDPIHSAAGRGILFNTAEGITVGRVGLGAFPLAFAAITLSCLISKKRLLIGIYNVLILIGAVLIVRVFGMITDNSVKESVGVLAPEIVLLVISLIALNLERRRRHVESETGAAD